MFIDERHVLATQAPEGRHVESMDLAAEPQTPENDIETEGKL